ncbi:nitroreductase family protein [Micromonospora sp. R77]|uniref:nitroreductase family protein n=1 Tax=Micromonospora sp. R77 TaxID=2925836 RepID=UPI001F6126B9|nr:nitroreductase family protein [Micromonospora sp. R77]MCI4061356.1 nitroreductase family protein [Micromonospora sp. R77]
MSWADLLWRRSAGRVPAGTYGFALTPSPVGEEALRAMLAWLAVPPPGGPLREVAARVRVTVALQRVGDRPTGAYRVVSGEPEPHRLDPHLLRRMQPGFGRPPSADTDAGFRHASLVWVFSTDVDALLDDLGPAAWSLLQLWCGWATQGLCLAAAAHGLVARPARSFDEHHVQPLAGLDRREVPVFMTVCGTSRFTEPMLDLRS